MVVKEALHELWRVLKGNKLLVAILFVLQILFVSIIAYLNVTYQLAIAENLQVIMGALENANYDDAAIKAGLPFLSGIADVLVNYQALLINLRKLVSFQIGSFLVIGLWRWALVHYLCRKQKILHAWGQLVLRALVFLVPLSLVGYGLVSSALGGTVDGAPFSSSLLYVALGVTAIGWYFMLVCLALPIGSLQESVFAAFGVGVKKIHYILPTLILCFGLVGLAAYLVSLSLAWAFWIMALCIALFFVIMTLMQLLFHSVVHRVSE